jgi:hypothetical protein
VAPRAHPETRSLRICSVGSHINIRWFSYKKGSQVEFEFPGTQSVVTPTVQDSYGRSGVPFVLNVESHLPPSQGGDAPRASGWSSQLGLGGRDGGLNAQICPPAGSNVPLRPDFDFGKARSQLEGVPAASFVAKAPVRFEPPNPKAFLPASVQSILWSIELWVEVTPTFIADYASQFGLAGCYDLCSWNGSSWNRVEQDASTILGAQCATRKPPVVK